MATRPTSPAPDEQYQDDQGKPWKWNDPRKSWETDWSGLVGVTAEVLTGNLAAAAFHNVPYTAMDPTTFGWQIIVQGTSSWIPASNNTYGAAWYFDAAYSYSSQQFEFNNIAVNLQSRPYRIIVYKMSSPSLGNPFHEDLIFSSTSTSTNGVSRNLDNGLTWQQVKDNYKFIRVEAADFSQCAYSSMIGTAEIPSNALQPSVVQGSSAWSRLSIKDITLTDGQFTIDMTGGITNYYLRIYGIREATLAMTPREVVVLATNLHNPAQAVLQSLYDGTPGFDAPVAVPQEVEAATQASGGSWYYLYLGHDFWWYKAGASGTWTPFSGGTGAPAAFGGNVYDIVTFK